MSETTNKQKKEDDEFYDAMSNTNQHTQASHEDVIEEIIKKQSELKLPDDEETEFHDADNTDITEGAAENVVDDAIDEEAMREQEKSMSEEDLLLNKEGADKLKFEGNELFKNSQALDSIEAYSKALRICPTTYTKERAILYGNRAAAKIKIDSKKSAIDDCSKAIELWPDYVRALLRRAKLYESDDKLDEALADYKRVNELDASQSEAREASVRLPPIINERNERMKEEMVSKLKDLGNVILKPFGLSTSNFQMQQDPNTGGYSINFKQS